GGEDAFRQAGAVVVAELVGGNDLAPRVAGDVRHQALHLGDAPFLEPAAQRAFLLLLGTGLGFAGSSACTHAVVRMRSEAGVAARRSAQARHASPNARKIAR